jgi:cobalt-zinc-cadmium resistance protein CzcA
MRVSEPIAGVRADVAIKLYGDDLAVLQQKADKIERIVSEIPGAEDAKAASRNGRTFRENKI